MACSFLMSLIFRRSNEVFGLGSLCASSRGNHFILRSGERKGERLGSLGEVAHNGAL